MVPTAATYVAFRYLTRWLGLKSGYLAGFLFYRLFWCLVPSSWILGSYGLVQIFQDVRPRFGQPAWLGLLLLVIPLLLGYGYAFPRALKLDFFIRRLDLRCGILRRKPSFQAGRREVILSWWWLLAWRG